MYVYTHACMHAYMYACMDATTSTSTTSSKLNKIAKLEGKLLQYQTEIYHKNDEIKIQSNILKQIQQKLKSSNVCISRNQTHRNILEVDSHKRHR